MAPTLSGCFDPPPEYTVPVPVPPVLIVDQIVPSTATVYQTSFSTVVFTVPFRADDAGEALTALFVPDLPTGPLNQKNTTIRTAVVPADPRPFAEQTNRSFPFTWQWQRDVAAGCHTITMILSRLNNFDFTTTIGVITIKDELATARITWLMSLGPATTCGIWPDPSVGSSP